MMHGNKNVKFSLCSLNAPVYNISLSLTWKLLRRCWSCGWQFNKHRSKARSQAPGLESTSISITVWISRAGKRTVMVNAGDTAQLLPSGQRENLLTLTRSEQSSRNMPALGEAKW